MTRRRGLRVVVAATSAAALLAVFLAYRQPGLVVDLANRIWACF